MGRLKDFFSPFLTEYAQCKKKIVLLIKALGFSAVAYQVLSVMQPFLLVILQ
jgi:hypothetical protein